MENKPRKLFTLVFVFDENKQRLLLGFKKRGFGSGKWNGFGGKIEPGETIADAAMRELNEECGLSLKTKPLSSNNNAINGCHDNGLRFTGINLFNFIDSPIVFEVHIFKISYSMVEGAVTESDEMKPQWFDYADIPYDKMWPDDRHWFPSLFKEDVTFTGQYTFESIETDIIIQQELKEEKCS